MFRAGQDPKMMTEEEREIFFQRDESFTERFSDFWQSAPLVKKVREFDALGKYSSLHNSVFNYGPLMIIAVYYMAHSNRFSVVSSGH
ncbi:unnamed protein product [Oikopleura dioica]|uniref:Uncharacterized protein n=1 Tax=Oikopleura dioica TaxID=34765 RepID=E4YW90_OIKDI|nr:unnamed protein product [Oikopleura dioica]